MFTSARAQRAVKERRRTNCATLPVCFVRLTPSRGLRKGAVSLLNMSLLRQHDFEADHWLACARSIEG
jgi:hypothetical protein